MPATGFGGSLFQAAWVPAAYSSGIGDHPRAVLPRPAGGRVQPLLLTTLVLLTITRIREFDLDRRRAVPVAPAMTGQMLLIEAAPRRRISLLSWCTAATILAICLAWPLLHDQFLATGTRAGGSPITSVPPGPGNHLPDGLHRIFDVPAYWLLLLPIEFPAVYVTGAVSLWAYLRRRDPDGGGGDEKSKRQRPSRCSRPPALCAPGCSPG